MFLFGLDLDLDLWKRIVILVVFVFVQTLEMLEKKEKVLQKKAAGELERAKEFTRAKNKRCMNSTMLFVQLWKSSHY